MGATTPKGESYRAQLYVTRIEESPAAPHVVHLFLMLAKPHEAGTSDDEIGLATRLFAWRSYLGDATDPALSAEDALLETPSEPIATLPSDPPSA